MHPRSIANTIQATMTTIERQGGKLDRTTLDALSKAVEDARKVADWRPRADGGLIALAYAAVVDDRDPFDDPDVNRAFLCEHILQSRGRIEEYAASTIATAAREHLDGIVAGLDKAYQVRVAEPIARDVAVLREHGITSTSDPATVLSAGPAAAAAWAGMTSATESHGRITGVYDQLRTALGVMSSEPIFWWADPAELTLTQVRRAAQTPSPRAIHEAGMTLGLATPLEASDRHSRAATADMGDPVAEAAAERRATQAFYGMVTA